MSDDNEAPSPEQRFHLIAWNRRISLFVAATVMGAFLGATSLFAFGGSRGAYIYIAAVIGSIIGMAFSPFVIMLWRKPMFSGLCAIYIPAFVVTIVEAQFGIVIYFSVATLIVASLIVRLNMRDEPYLLPAGMCSECGYNLEFNATGVCPECGRHIAQPDNQSGRARSS